MATLVDDDTDSFFGRSNRRRCVKGRTSYIEPSELIINEKNDRELNNSKNCNENAYEECIEVDDVDEEPITIDLSEFLNANPSITETASENVIDSSAGLSDCHSQFRVTSSLSDASVIPIPDLVSLKPCSNDEILHHVEIPNCHQESSSVILAENGFNEILNTVDSLCKENNHNNLTNSTSSFVSVKSISLPKSLQKYQTLSRTKDFNKSNARVFGKYPVVKCEKLDIENFVKKNSIKVRNWPLPHVNDYKKTNSQAIKTVNLNKKLSPQNIKDVPRLFNKSISFTRLNSISPNASTNKVRSILVSSLESPQLGYTHNQLIDGVNNLHTPQIFSLNKKPNIVTKEQLVKLVGNKVTISQANKLIVQKQNTPVITTINKVPEGSQSYQFVSPQTIDQIKNAPGTPILPKPTIQSVATPLALKDYTVIQPYVEDPTSPVKPKPILTVPIDVVPTINQPDLLNLSSKAGEFSQKSLIKANSVFLNGAIKKISSPKKVERKYSALRPDFGQISNVFSLNKLSNVVEPEIKDHSSVMKAKSSIVDAMKSVFTKTQPKKISRPRQNLCKDNTSHSVDTSLIGCNAYNSTLNDIIFGFDDFAEDNFSYSGTVDVSEEALDTQIKTEPESLEVNESNQTASIENENIDVDSISVENIKNKNLLIGRKYKRRKKGAHSPHDSDTLTASEGEENSNQRRMSYTPRRKYRKLSDGSKGNQTGKPKKSPLKPFNIKQEIECDTPEKLTETIIEEVNSVMESSLDQANVTDSISPTDVVNSVIASCETNSDLTEEKSPNIEKISKEKKLRLSQSPKKIESDLGKAKKIKSCKGKNLSRKKVLSSKQKHSGIRYLHSRFKTKMKKIQKRKPVSKKRKMSSKPSDIIQEIKTITGGLIRERNKKKGDNRPLENNTENVDPSTSCARNSKNQTLKSKKTKRKKRLLPLAPKTKKIQTLQVSFTRSTHKRSKSCNTLDGDNDLSLDEIALESNEGDSSLASISNQNTDTSSNKVADLMTDKKEELVVAKVDDSFNSEVIDSLDNKKEDSLMEKDIFLKDKKAEFLKNKVKDSVDDKNDEAPKAIREIVQMDEKSDQPDVALPPSNAEVIEAVSADNVSSENVNITVCEVDVHVPNIEGQNETCQETVISVEDNSTKENAVPESSEMVKKTEKVQDVGIKTTRRSKKCPKVKISVAKPAKSSSLGRNWYISERKDSTDSVLSEDTVSKQNQSNANKCHSKSPNVETTATETHCEFANETIDNSSSNNIDVVNVSPNSEIVSTPLPEKDDSLNNLTETDMVTAAEKSLGSLFVPPVKIKEEPVDIEEDLMEYSATTAINVKLEDALVSDPLTVYENTKRTRKRTSLNSTGRKNIKIELNDSNEKENSIATPKNKGKRKSGTSAAQLYAKAQSSSIKSSPKVPTMKSSSKVPKIKNSPKVEIVESSLKASVLKSSPKTEVNNSPNVTKKVKYSIEAVTLPFSQGWMRELVHRATQSIPGKKQCDIYYFAPEGIKLRSMPDILNYLSKHPESKLTSANFTFAKDLIYREPFEIERGAKFKTSCATSSPAACKESLPKTVKKKQTPSSTCKITPILNKKKTPVKLSSNVKVQSVCDKSSLDAKTESNNNENKSRFSRKITKKVPFDYSSEESVSAKKSKKVTATPSAIISSSDSTNNKTNKTVINQVPAPSISSETTTTPKLTQNKTKKKILAEKTSTLKSVLTKDIELNTQTLCSPRCLAARFQIPSVQCSICLCLFHPNCVPFMSRKIKFACKSCTMAKLVYYESIRNSTATSPEISADENITEASNQLDLSLLYPESSWDIPPETNKGQAIISFNPQTSTPCVISPAPSRFPIVNTLMSPINYSYPKNTSLQSPQLLSHLLQTKTPQKNYSKTLLNAPPFPVTQILPTPSGCPLPTKYFRVRLPVDGGPVMLPNSLMIKRLPDRRIMVCSTSNAPGLPRPNVKLIKKSNVQNSLPTLLPKPDTTPMACDVSPQNDPVNNEVVSPLSSLSNMVDRTLSDSEGTKNASSLASGDLTTSNTLDNTYENDSMSISNLPIDSEESSDSSWDLNRLRKSCECLNLIFKKLNICDLLQARQVCCSWRQLASQRFLWKKVALEGLTITDWKKCCLSLLAHGTKSLDLSGVIHPDVDKPWENLESSVLHLSGIEELIFDQIPPSLLKTVVTHLPQLRRLECHFVTPACTEPEVWLTPCHIELSPFQSLSKLVRLKLGSGGGIILHSGNSFVMPHLPNLRHVALTGFNFHSHLNLEFLSKQSDLISLELGDCVGVEPEIYPLLGTLTKLKSLRLENGGSISDVKFAEALSQMEGLEVLELMNFRISSMLADSFKNLRQLIHVNIWPDNTQEEALVNQNFYNAMSNIKDLEYVCWGVIAENDSVPDKLKLKDSGKVGVKNELTFEELFKRLVALFPECRVEVKCVPRKLWREFCSTRK